MPRKIKGVRASLGSGDAAERAAGAAARLVRPGGVLLDELGELAGALALGVVAHPLPDLDVGLRQRRPQRADVLA
jgi:hypothetical protein